MCKVLEGIKNANAMSTSFLVSWWDFSSCAVLVFLFSFPVFLSGPIAVPPLQLQLPVDVPVEQIKGQYLAGQLPIHWCQKLLSENYKNGLHKQRLGWNEKCVNIWQFEWSLILNADWLVICLMPTSHAVCHGFTISISGSPDRHLAFSIWW